MKDIERPSGICFSENGDTFIITMKKSGMESNMQKDSAAFEAWALVARSKGYSRVLLEISSLPEGFHSNRFLYRALRFSESFDWFSLSPELQKWVSQFRNDKLDSGNLVYNVPTRKAKEAASNPEAQEERKFIRAPAETNKKLGANVKTYYSQLPVGLFQGKKAIGAEIFPRGTAAIDFWGLEDDVFHLVELKARDNYSLGVLSELFFYVNFVYDMHCKKMATPSEKTKLRGFDELLNSQIKKVKGYILLQKSHPQLKDAFAELKKCKEENMCFERIISYED